MVKKLYAEGSAENTFIDGNKPVQTIPLVKNVAEVIARMIGNTLGPGGRNYMTGEGITNDGVSVLKEIRFEDEREDSIADAFEEIARRQDTDAGDATTTATLIGCETVKLAVDDVMPIDTPIPGSKTVMDIKRALEEECTQAVDLLAKGKRELEQTDIEEIENVAKTAMEGHESYKIIAETIAEVGKDSNTAIADGFNGKVEKAVVPGIEYPLKIQTPSMYTNVTRKEAVYENPIVIVANHVFESYSDLSMFMSTMMEEKKARKEGPQPIVVVGKHFSVQFTSQIVGVTRASKIPILLLSCDGLRDEEIMDIAEYVDATYIDTHPKEGKSIKQLAYADAGTAKKIIAGDKQTSFIDGRGLDAQVPVEDMFLSRVEARVKDIKSLAEREQNPETRELLERRAAGLTGGVATLYVDAKTAVDRYYLKKKVEDAMNSCKSALEGGTVKGGGVALKEVAEQMGKETYLGRSLSVVYDRIVKNAGGELEIPDDVRDAFYTNKCAIENAVAVVKILVTMEGVIADKRPSMVDDLGKALGYEG